LNFPIKMSYMSYMSPTPSHILEGEVLKKNSK
jgi:hypothetical protein